MGQDRAKHGLFDTAYRETDLFARQIRRRSDGTIGQRQQAVQRRGHQRADPLQGQTFVDLQVQLRLIGNRKICLACGDQLGRVGGIGGGDDLYAQVLFGEVPFFLRHDDRPVVGVHEPVQQQDHVVLRQRRARGQRQRGQNVTKFHRFVLSTGKARPWRAG